MAYIRIAVRPALIAFAVLAATTAGVLLISSSAAGGDRVAKPPAGRLGEELTDMRTRTSKTFASPDGRGYVSRVFSTPVHYKDVGGDWQEIENELIRDTDMASFTNRANRYKVDLPMRLAGKPVRIAEGGRWVSFGLEDAGAAQAAISANRARYDGAFPGVRVELEAQADTLKETLTLASAAARSSFAYRLETSDGLRARATRDGGVEVVDRDGEAHFALPAPFVYEQAEGESEPAAKARFALERDGDAWRLRLTVDRDWLERPGRRFPVVVDPTTTLTGPGHDCTLDNEVPTTSACSNTTFSAGHWNGF